MKSVDSHAIFDSFDHQLPSHEQLTVEPTGFLADTTHVYGFRRAAQSLDTGSETDLYNGTLKSDGNRPRFQATEGHGLYIANTPAATYVPGIKGDTVYALRIPKNSNWLDSHNPSEQTAQRIAAGLHRLRGSVIGVPNPGTKGWDRLYEDTDVVSFAPMAMARLILGRTVALGDGRVKPRWAVVRTPGLVEVVGQQPAQKQYTR